MITKLLTAYKKWKQKRKYNKFRGITRVVRKIVNEELETIQSSLHKIHADIQRWGVVVCDDIRPATTPAEFLDKEKRIMTDEEVKIAAADLHTNNSSIVTHNS